MKTALKLLLLVMAVLALVQVAEKNRGWLTTSHQIMPEKILIAGEGSPGP